ncbi:nucleotidyltransferase domain-containing protein [Weissella minor]|uniref:nucleotidyltransferase domain-containing protein n=1 Tax=Weissella minor TaxID=1620 RepID=UPI003AF20FA7
MNFDIGQFASKETELKVEMRVMWDVRIDSQITTDQVADIMGMPSDEVSRLESARMKLTPELVQSYTEAVKSLVTTPTQEEIKAFSKETAYEFNLQQVALFGSFAKNKQTYSSDIDFMIYGHNNSKVPYHDIANIMQLGNERLKRSIHITDYFLIQRNLDDPRTFRFHARYQLERKNMI